MNQKVLFKRALRRERTLLLVSLCLGGVLAFVAMYPLSHLAPWVGGLPKAKPLSLAGATWWFFYLSGGFLIFCTYVNAGTWVIASTRRAIRALKFTRARRSAT